MTAPLVRLGAPPYLPRMRTPALLVPALIVALCLSVALGAAAQTHHAARPAARPAHPGPKELGKFEDWVAATHQESGATVCYAFTRYFA